MINREQYDKLIGPYKVLQDAIETFGDKYADFRNKLYDTEGHCDDVDVDGKNIYITYVIYDYQTQDETLDITVPVDYLFMEDEEWQQLVREKYDRLVKKEAELKQKLDALAQDRQEQQERLLYEKLKDKFKED